MGENPLLKVIKLLILRCSQCSGYHDLRLPIHPAHERHLAEACAEGYAGIETRYRYNCLATARITDETIILWKPSYRRIAVQKAASPFRDEEIAS